MKTKMSLFLLVLTATAATFTTLSQAAAQAASWQQIPIPSLPAFTPQQPKRIELANGMEMCIRDRQNRQKIFEQRRIRLQIRRKLKQHRPEFAGRCQRLNGREKSRQKVVRRLESLDVGDDLMRLDAETKVCRRILHPVLNRRFFDQLPKREIDFDGVQLRGVVVQELLLRQLGWIEIRLPRRVSPS